LIDAWKGGSVKGIAHFLTGVALATCFPDVVRQAIAGSLLPMLGGIGGLLPDSIDFKFVRFFERYGVEIDPGPDIDAEVIATMLAKAVCDVHTSGRPCNVMLHTIQMDADLWRRYTVRWAPAQNEIGVRIGPLVNTAQVPWAGTEPERPEAVRHPGVAFSHAYQESYHIDSFSGPSFRLVKVGDAVQVRFLDWHHRWSHSLLVGAAVGLLIGLVAGALWGAQIGLWSGALIAMGFAAHALEDQLGFMGCNLLWPLSRTRWRGLGLFHASDAAPNFLVVWTSITLILLNLDRYAAQPAFPVLLYLALMIGLPWSAFLVRNWIRRAKRASTPVASSPQTGEVAAEGQEQGVV
jgi:membrane-bound metal-dependent hydrolase YbcI (DUF457 family)